jgi:translation initiation factor 1
MTKDWKERLGMVYSTNPNYQFEKEEDDSQDTLIPKQQKLIVSLDKRNRKGKAVTLISGFIGQPDDLEQLGKLLKTKCGVGGTVKGGNILIQGDFRDKVVAILHGEDIRQNAQEDDDGTSRKKHGSDLIDVHDLAGTRNFIHGPNRCRHHLVEPSNHQGSGNRRTGLGRGAGEPVRSAARLRSGTRKTSGLELIAPLGRIGHIRFQSNASPSSSGIR